MKPASLLLVGCGHLGTAMLRRWLAVGAVSRVHVVKPSALPQEFQNNPVIGWTPTLDAFDNRFEPDVIVLAVRPPSLDAVLPATAKFRNSLFLSVIAGKSLGHMAALLNPSVPGKPAHAIICTMPNMAAEIGAGMTFGTMNGLVTASQRQMAEMLLRAMGEVAWLNEEAGFDAGTALSGCGPAYVFALVEAMAAAGEKQGLPREFAARLARQTIIGSGAILAQSPESAAALRDAIGSPGSMTEAALKILLGENGLNDLMQKAVTAAVDQAKKLAR